MLHLGEAVLVAVAAKGVRRLVRIRARVGVRVRVRVRDVGTCGPESNLTCVGFGSGWTTGAVGEGGGAPAAPGSGSGRPRSCALGGVRGGGGWGSGP